MAASFSSALKVTSSHLLRRPRRLSVVVVAALSVIVATPSLAGADSYTVEPGDSLSVIARDNGVSTAELAAINGISDLHLIRVGQVLELPKNTYTVTAGDTLSAIAVHHGTTSRHLAEINGLADSNLIRVGQELKLPSGSTSVTTSPAPVNPAARYPALPSRLMANPDRLALIPSFEKWSEHYGVPTDLVMAVAYRESGWQQGVTSPAGAIGVGQILPRTAEWLANDLIQRPELDPSVADDNIRMSARFLSWLIGYMGGVDAAVAAYYQGPTSVSRIGLYDDTKEYVENIAQIRSRFRTG